MISASKKATHAHNPLLEFVEGIKHDANHRNPLIDLSLGDPTLGKNMICPNVLNQAIKGLIDLHSANGYQPSCGNPWTRKGIVQFSLAISHVTFRYDYPLALAASNYCLDLPFDLNEDDVMIASGVSGCLQLVFDALLNIGDNILIPCPTVPLYQVLIR